MNELIEWLRDVGQNFGSYPDQLYKTGVELCERYSKNQAIKATFRVIRPTPLHKKLLRNTLKSTALLLERKEEAAVKKKRTESCRPKSRKPKPRQRNRRSQKRRLHESLRSPGRTRRIHGGRLGLVAR